MLYRLLLSFVVSVLSLTSLSGCGAGLGVIATVGIIVSEALAVIQGIDRVVQEFFLRHPEVSTSTRMEYLRLSQAVQDALVVFQHTAKGSESLTAGDAAAAFVAFQQAWEELMRWLQNNGLQNQEGALMIEGQLVSEPLPSAKVMAEKALAE